MSGNALQWLGTISLAITLLLGLIILARNPLDHAETISYRIASKKHYYLAMAVALTTLGVAFYLYIFFWLIPQYKLPSFTYFIVAVAFTAQMLVAWVPADPNPKTLQHFAHLLGGVVVASAMTLCIWILVFSGTGIHPLAYTLSVLTAISSVVCYITLLIGMKYSSKTVLFSEILFILLFSTCMFVLCWDV